MAALCFLAYTNHWIFGGAVLLIAGVMVIAMLEGSSKNK